MNEKKSETLKLPGELLAVLRAARAVVRARIEVKNAQRDGVKDAVLKAKAAAFRKRLDELERAVLALEERAEALKAAALRGAATAGKPPKKAFDWGGLFNALGKVVDLAGAVRAGAPQREVVKQAADIIDAEIIG